MPRLSVPAEPVRHAGNPVPARVALTSDLRGKFGAESAGAALRQPVARSTWPTPKEPGAAAGTPAPARARCMADGDRLELPQAVASALA
jgi:hypothetical protein